MQIQKVFFWKSPTVGTYFRLRFFSYSSEQYSYGKGFKLTFGLCQRIFFYRKEYKDVMIILLGLRFHYQSK